MIGDLKRIDCLRIFGQLPDRPGNLFQLGNFGLLLRQIVSKTSFNGPGTIGHHFPCTLTNISDWILAIR